MSATVVGRDINPVATLVQRQALQRWDEGQLRAAHRQVEQACRSEIDGLHVSASGDSVLYYFWVAVAECPSCTIDVELFSSYVFAQHAYPRRYPSAQATCPRCHSIVLVDLSTDGRICCPQGHESSFAGPVQGQYMTCVHGHRSKIVDALDGVPPGHRMYAKLVLRGDGRKVYEAIDDFDLGLVQRAERLLADCQMSLVLPSGSLDEGVNTRQAIRWGYRRWQHFFNARQLYSLGLLGAAIRDLDTGMPEREALAAFSPVASSSTTYSAPTRVKAPARCATCSATTS
jgi:putative DNA methylase